MLRQLTDSEWVAGAKTLCTAVLSLLYLTAEYCAPVCCCSTYTHFIGNVLYDIFHVVTGCLHPTPIDNLPILSSIQPAGLC